MLRIGFLFIILISSSAVVKFDRKKQNSSYFMYENNATYMRRENAKCNETILLWRSVDLVKLLLIGANEEFRISRRKINKLQKIKNGNRRARRNQLTVLSQNIPQGTNKDLVGVYLDLLINVHKPAILFINEVDAETVNASCPEGYSFIKGSIKDAKTVRLCAIVRKDLKVEQQEMACEIPTLKLKSCGWTIVGFYREWRRGSRTECTAKEIIYCSNLNNKLKPPLNTEDIRLQCARFESFAKAWKNLGIIRNKVCLIGDMNINYLRSDTVQQKRLRPMKDIILDEFVCNNWVQLIRNITRRPVGRQNHEPACLDHMYVTKPRWVGQIINSNIIGRDHNVIGGILNTDKEVFQKRTFSVRKIDKVCPITFQRVFQSTNPIEILTKTDLDEAVQSWEDRVVWTLNQLAPSVTITPVESFSPWLSKKRNPELVDELKKVKQIEEWAKTKKTKSAWQRAREARKSINIKVQRAKEEYRTEFLQETETEAQFWERLKRCSDMTQQNENSIELHEEGRVITNSAELAELFNNYFKEKVELLHEKITQNVDLALKRTDDHIKKFFGQEERNNFLGPVKTGFQTVEDKVILGIINNLKSSGAEGPDGLNTKIIKRFRTTMVPYLRYITNLAIMQSKYPSRWKMGIISPLPKSGNKHLKKNWRPVVLLCPASKILEKCLQVQIVGHLEARQIFPRTQHAYRKGKSCESALIDLNTQTEEARNRGMYVGTLITDMSAAFNLITKEVLCPKMARFGFDEPSCRLLHDYLTGRQTKCKIKSTYSRYVKLSSGVGEGSVLGPTFFACGLIDIDQVGVLTKAKCAEVGVEVEVKGVEFADDCTGILICKTEEDLQIAVNVMIEEYQTYFESNNLCLNREKCQILIYRPKTKVKEIYVLDKCEENNVRLLGCYQDTEGEYESHFNYVKRKCQERIIHLKRCAKYLTKYQRKKACEALILSIINYGISIYARTKKIQDKITILVNDAMRLVLDVRNPRDMHVVDLYKQLSTMSVMAQSGTLWLDGPNLYEFNLVMVFRRVLRKNCAPITCEQIVNAPIRTGLRKGGEMKQVGERKQPWKRPNTKFADRAFLVNAIRTLNVRKLNWILEDEGRIKKEHKEHSLHYIKKTIKKRLVEQNGNGG